MSFILTQSPILHSEYEVISIFVLVANLLSKLELEKTLRRKWKQLNIMTPIYAVKNKKTEWQ